jgi:hypothetical protein
MQRSVPPNIAREDGRSESCRAVGIKNWVTKPVAQKHDAAINRNKSAKPQRPLKRSIPEFPTKVGGHHMTGSTDPARDSSLGSRIRPCRVQRKQRNPGLGELAALDPVTLHSCPGATLAGRRIRPHERKAKPRTIVGEGVIVDEDTDAWPLLMDSSELRRIGFRRHRPVAFLIVPDVMRPDATRNQIVLAFVPNQFPSVE